MLPALNFRYGYYLQKSIFGNFCNLEEVIKFTRNFESYFKKYDKTILKRIEYYSGFKWKTKQINVWIFDGYFPSISFPLLLNWYGGDKKFVLFSLVHELVHTILLDVEVYKEKKNKFDSVELEAIVELITKNVIKHIFDSNTVKKLCKQAEMNGEYLYVWKREGELENIWNLEKKPFKKWIKNKKRYKIIV